MLEILNINTNDLLDDQLDHETIDLGSSNFDTQSVNLDSSSLDPTALNPIRLSELEKAVDLLKSFGIVRYDANLNLTDKQKKQVKDNIGITDSGEILINTTDYWDSKVGYTPPAGTIIIYTDKSQIDGKPVPGIKIGSGNAYIQDLAFVSEEIENILLNHVDNSNVHVSLEDKSKWNNKQDVIDDLEDIRENASAGATAYQKPASGIPESDMSEGVQTSLEKANSAVQTETDPVFSGSPAAEITRADINTWNAKQPAIADLADIREGAAAGATALQSEEDPIFSASAANGITAEDIASWNEHTSNIGTITGVSVNGTSVATSGVANISSVPASILEGTIPSGITAITLNQGDGSNKIATTSYVDTAINNLPDPMIFRGSLGTGGTITTLPTAASTNVGYTYKVIEDGTYANQSAKIGDTFISDGSAWILIPSGDEPSGTVTSIKIEANSPIVIDNDAAISTSGTRTLSHATSGVTAGTYRAVTVNNTGHVTAGTTEAIYILTTNWNSTATQCYLRSQYFLNSLVPTQKGDLILCRGNGNLFKCGDLVYDSQEEVYYTNPTYLCNVLVAQGTSSQFIKGDGSLDSNTYAGAQTSGGAANKAVSIPFGQVDSTSTSTAFTATVDGITELRDGVCVYLKNGVVTSAANCTLNVNGLGDKPMYNTMAATTAISTQWNVNYTMLFIYNSTRVSGGCWDMYYGYYSDANSVGYQLRRNNSVLPASDTSRYYKIFFTSADNTKWVPASADSTNNATSARPVNQRPINPFGPIEYLSTTTTYTAGKNIPASSLWQQYNVTLGYSFNRTDAALTLTTSKPVFIKCAPQNDGSAIIDANTPYVQDLPTTEDGKIYIFLGVAYSATAVEMQMVHPVYYYKNGSINLWTGTGTQTDVSKSTESNVIDIGEYDLMKINEVKGKSLVMNQLVQNSNNDRSFESNGITFTDNRDGSFTIDGTATANTTVYSRFKAETISGHKYYAGGSSKFLFTGVGDFSGRITSVTNARSGDHGYVTILEGDSFDNDTFHPMLIDLTQMFGAGNEPTTVEEVEAILGEDYYEYNTGEVVGNNVEKLDVTGFNIWDEEWEVGKYGTDGTKSNSTTTIRCKNPIPINSGKSYYFRVPDSSGGTYTGFYLLYDSNNTFISRTTFLNGDIITIPSGASYMTFYVRAEYGTTYNNDICINKSNTSKNGTYEPYKHSEFPLNLTELTGKVKTLVWMQEALPFSQWTTRSTVSGASVVHEDGTLDLYYVFNNWNNLMGAECSFIAGHKYYIKFSGTRFDFASTIVTRDTSGWVQVDTIGTISANSPTLKTIFIPTTSVDGVAFRLDRDTTKTSSNYNTFNPLNVFDLTQIFGEGNEPTVKEFDALFPNEYYPYNAGEVNSDDISGIIYPDGLHGVGTAYDSLIVDEDGYARRAVKRMGSVDLGSLNWVIDNERFRCRYKFELMKGNTTALMCPKYTSSQLYVESGQYIFITDSSYTTAADFKTAMSGVMLYYELATPIEYVLDTPVQCVAKVYPNGTVKQVPVMPDSTPVVMDVTYLRDNGGFIGGMMNKLASLEARIAALEEG